MTKQAPEQAPTLYGVYRVQDGAQIVTDVDSATATSECARLNAEARVVVGEIHEVVGHDEYGQAIVRATGKPKYHGMYLGELVRYEARSRDGLVIA
jgi:hypothetical protein